MPKASNTESDRKDGDELGVDPSVVPAMRVAQSVLRHPEDKRRQDLALRDLVRSVLDRRAQ